MTDDQTSNNDKKLFNVAVIGATGAVGETMIEILDERDFPVAQLFPVASERSAGKRVPFRGKHVVIEDLATFDFKKVDLALFSAGGSISEQYAPKAVDSGCIVIDNTSHFRNEDDIPLIIPEVNPHRIGDYGKRGIIANPNCSTIQMLVALKPLHDAGKITRINVATYQAVSGTGKCAIKELAVQTTKLLNAQSVQSEVYPKQIAFNVLPQIDTFQDNGYTREEMKMVWETQKILEDTGIQVNPTCVRVPVFFGHSEAVHVEFERKITLDQARSVLAAAPGVVLLDDRTDGGYPTPVTEGAGQDATYVGRLREDISHSRALALWIVSDNVRKGAALNSIQIAEHLIKRCL